jgi:hypothetical protein
MVGVPALPAILKAHLAGPTCENRQVPDLNVVDKPSRIAGAGVLKAELHCAAAEQGQVDASPPPHG